MKPGDRPSRPRHVADLGGHLWEIAHNPFVPLADSGQMLLPDD